MSKSPISQLINCHFIVRDGEIPSNAGGEDERVGTPIFEFDDNGRAAVQLNGYLIAPLELFSEEQLRKLAKEYHAFRKRQLH
jgi:hypothetical protein